MADELNEVKTINGYFKKQNIAARIGVDTVELIDENFELITGGTATVTDRKLIECMLDLALSKVKPDVNSQKRIQELVGQVDLLTIDNDKLIKANDMLVGNNKQLQEDLSNSVSTDLIEEKNNAIDLLKREKQNLYEEKARIEGKLLSFRQNNAIPEGGMIVILNPGEKKVIDATAKAETERTGAEVTPGLLLKNVFFFVLVNGPHDVFKAPVSIQQIRELMSAAGMGPNS
jgi:hypothetical protein